MGLFPIGLEGSGTAEVESFASYVHRLAYEHGVYVGELVRYAVGTQPKNCKAVFFYRKPQELVRPSLTTRALVEAFEFSTSVPSLTRGILWFLENPLALSGEEVCDGFRWCTNCFIEMNELGIPPYFKLMWHMNSLSNCPIHGNCLVGVCPACGEGQETYRKCFPLDCCQHCGASLWKGLEFAGDSTSLAAEEWEGGDILQLFNDLANYPLYGFPENGPVLSLDKIFDHYWVSDREGELYALINRDVLLAAMHSSEKMTLRTARRLCYLLGISIIDLLAGEAHNCAGVLSAEWVCEVEPSFMQKRRRSPHDHANVSKRIKAILATENLPPSLPELAQKLNVSTGYLEYRYPVIVTKLRAVRKRVAAEAREKTMLAARNSAVSYFAQELKGISLISRKQAYRQLRAETGLPKWVLKNAIQEVFAALYG